MSTEELYKFENLNFNNYESGGSSVYLEKGEDRQLLCDTYGDKDNFDDMELKRKIHETVRNYFKEKTKPSHR